MITAEVVYEIVRKVSGEIYPIGDSQIDRMRAENMKLFIEVFDKMHTAIDDIAYRYKDSPRSSERVIGKLCSDHLDKMGITE